MKRLILCLILGTISLFGQTTMDPQFICVSEGCSYAKAVPLIGTLAVTPEPAPTVFTSIGARRVVDETTGVAKISGYVSMHKLLFPGNKTWVGGRIDMGSHSTTPVASIYQEVGHFGSVKLYGELMAGVSQSKTATGLATGAGMAMVGRFSPKSRLRWVVSGKVMKANDGIHNSLYPDVTAGIGYAF